MPALSLEAFADALLQAFEQHRTDDVRALLVAHPALTRQSIHAAAAMADAEAVDRLLRELPSRATRALGPQQVPPIMLAAHGRLQDVLGVSRDDRVRTVQLLLDAGASPNTALPTDVPGHLPVPVLYFACVTNNVGVAQALLEAGAEPNDGESVYHAAEHDHRDCLSLLLAHGADLSARHPHWDNTPLYFLSGFPPDHPSAETAQRGLAWLLSHGANPNVPSLVRPQRDGRAGLAEFPLHRMAALGASADVLQLVVDHGAIVDAVRHDGATPLALATRAGHAHTAETLQAFGADPSRLTPLDHLIAHAMRGDVGAAQALWEAHPEVRALLAAPMADDLHAVLLRACQEGRVDRVAALLTLGWSLTQQAPWGGTALHWAAWHGQPAVVQQLMAAGAPINVRDTQYGSSPIAWAAHGSSFSRRGVTTEYIAVVQALATAGASRPESFNRWNESPESLAVPAVAAVLQTWAHPGELH